MSKNTEDVMKFLDGLDDFVASSSSESSPRKPPPTTQSEAASDVLSFLDNLDQTSSVVPAKKANQPAPPVSTSASNPVSAPGETSELQAQTANVPKRSLGVTESAEHVKEGHEDIDEDDIIIDTAAVANAAWGWAGSLWSSAQATASKVSSSAVTSLKMAESMVEDVVKSEKVKGIVSDVSGVVNRDTVGKLTNDFSKFTMNSVTSLGDIIAPPPFISYKGRSSSISHTLFSDAYKATSSSPKRPPIANTIIVWLCTELEEQSKNRAPTSASGNKDSEENSTHAMVTISPLDLIHDFVQTTCNGLWLHGGGDIPGGSGRAICRRVVVNSVTDPSPKPARGVQEAVKVVDAILQRLQKLAAETDADEIPPTPGKEGEPVPPTVTLFLIVQPFTTLIPSPLAGSAPGGTPTGVSSGTALHRHYLTMLVNPKAQSPGLDVVSAVSQSVRSDRGGGRSFGGKEMNADLKKLMEKWGEEQMVRVVEGSINDVLEEFSLRSKGVNVL